MADRWNFGTSYTALYVDGPDSPLSISHETGAPVQLSTSSDASTSVVQLDPGMTITWEARVPLYARATQLKYTSVVVESQRKIHASLPQGRTSPRGVMNVNGSQLFTTPFPTGWVAADANITVTTGYTSDYVLGDSSVYLASNTSNPSTQCNYQNLNVGAAAPAGYGADINMANSDIILVWKPINLDNAAKVNFYVGWGASSLQNNALWIVYDSAYGAGLDSHVRIGEWCYTPLNFADAIITGDMSTRVINDVRVQLKVLGAGPPVEILFGGFIVRPRPAIGTFVFSADDNDLSMWTQFRPALGTFRASLFAIADTVGGAGKLTWDQVDQLRTLGWEIGGHASRLANHNLRFTTLTDSVMDAEAQNLRSWLALAGGSAGVAYPGGYFSADVIRSLQGYFSYGRSIYSLQKHTILPPVDPYRIPAVSSITDGVGGTPLAAFQAMIDKCVAEKSLLVSVFHVITTGAPAATTQCSRAALDAIVAQVRGYVNAGTLQVKTLDEALRGY